MAVAEFEEKELEGPLNAQLSMGRPLWSPGQVLEKIVGFDAALHVDLVSFWASIGFGQAPRGLPVLASWWHGWPSALLRPVFRFRAPPTFRLNLFLQYKRPEYMIRGREWSSWAAPYFRFAVTPHQQRALGACASALGAAGLVAYGSPAFHTRTELFSHIENGTLAANTHFAPVLPIGKHALYSYVSARGAGKAHSEPVDVQSLSFADDPSNGPPNGPPIPPGDGGSDDSGSPKAILRAAAKGARAAVDASPKLVGSAELFERILRRAQDLADDLPFDVQQDGRAAISAYLVAAVFARLSGVAWLVQ